jgi:hypothetical protein
VVPASYHDFFSACATVAGALIGLLFVAISISPAKLSGPSAENDHQLKAAMAFSALVNTMVIALVKPADPAGCPARAVRPPAGQRRRAGRIAPGSGAPRQPGGIVHWLFGFAIARAWALVGARDSSLLAAVVEMARRPGGPDTIPPAHGGQAEETPAPAARENLD